MKTGFYSKLKNFLLLTIVGFFTVASLQAHRIEYYTSNGCITIGQTLSVDAYVVSAGGDTRYNWQYKTTSGSWTCFINGTNSINSTNFTVSGATGTGANNAPTLTIANATAALEDVQLRCLMRDNTSPCSSGGSANDLVYGGDAAALDEVKTLRLKVTDAATCAASCTGNVLTNTSGYYGGFELVSYTASNAAYTDNNFGSTAGTTDFASTGTGAGSYDVINNPYAFISTFTRFAPHSGNYQMVVKGNTSTTSRVWYKTVSVTPGAIYNFSVWVAKVDGSAPKIQLKAVSSAGTFNLNTATALSSAIGSWQQVTGSYGVPAGVTSVTFAITEASTIATNYSLDDICVVLDKQPITIGDYVWYDVNKNGQQDGGEPAIANATVKLFSPSDLVNPVQTDITDANGAYSFTSVIQGSYFVQFAIPAGYTGFTTQNASGVAVGLNSDANAATGNTATINFTANNAVQDAGFVKNLMLSGNVYLDSNGMADNKVSGRLISAAATTLYANLYSSSNVFISSVAVSGGVYSFSNLAGNTTYIVAISATQGVAGSAPSSVLTGDWVNTGEIVGTGTGNDGTVNGLLSCAVTTVSLTNANFGLEQRPTAIAAMVASQLNPGGVNSVTVPATSFAPTDPEKGVRDIRIVDFPAANANSITIRDTTYYDASVPTTTCPTAACKLFPAAGVTIPTNVTGTPTYTIKIDPVDGAVTTEIEYVAIDSARQESKLSAKVSVPFTIITLEGTVWNDVNGDVAKASTEAFVSGTNVTGNGSVVTGGNLFVNLVNASNVVLQSVQVTATGAFIFDKVPAATTGLKVQLSTVQGVTGSTAPAITMPAKWIATGDIAGAVNGATQTGALNQIEVTTVSSSITGLAFGIELLPTPNNIALLSRGNPGGNNRVQLADTSFKSTDPDGTVSAMRIVAFPTNVTSIGVKDTTYYVNAAAVPATCPSLTCKAFPVTGVTIPLNATTGNPTLAVYVDPADGNVTPAIRYIAIDNANKQSIDTATTTVPFTVISITGTVWNDGNGNVIKTASEMFVSGTNVSNSGSVVTGGLLYANLINGTNVIQVVQVNNVGGYTFDKVPPSTSGLKVQLTSVPGVVNSAQPATSIPATWTNTGTIAGTNNAAAQTGAAINIILVTTGTTSIPDQAFGIERLPTPLPTVYSQVNNPGNKVNIAVADTSFKSTDLDGTVSFVRITGFPTNVTSIRVKDTTYYTNAAAIPTACPTLRCMVFPVYSANTGGVMIPTTAAGIITLPVSIDPVDGNVTPEIPFMVTDNAGKQSSSASYVRMPLGTPAPLPVTLTSFTGVKDQCVAQLSWSTANEVNAASFEIEVSNDGRQYNAAGTVKAIGNSISVTNYSFTYQMQGGVDNIFRLKMIDLGGSYTYSQVLKMSCANIVKQDVVIAPNPVVNVANINGLNGKNTITVVDVNGRSVKSTLATEASVQLDLSNLGTGIYMIRIISENGEIITRKLVKQ